MSSLTKFYEHFQRACLCNMVFAEEEWKRHSVLCVYRLPLFGVDKISLGKMEMVA